MNGNIYKSAGIAVGILIGLILAVALILIANNNRKFKTEYDERQLRVRGDAYRYAFYSVIICEVILLILAIGEFTLPIPEYVLHFGGILIGCLVLSLLGAQQQPQAVWHHSGRRGPAQCPSPVYGPVHRQRV